MGNISIAKVNTTLINTSVTFQWDGFQPNKYVNNTK